MIQRTQRTRAARPAFTLLEIVLAMTIGVALMWALYVAMSVQLKQSDQARGVVQESELAKNIFGRISRDTAACVPSTYSMTNFQGKWPGGGGGGGGGGGSSGGSGGSSGGASGGSGGSSGGASGGSSGSSPSSGTPASSTPSSSSSASGGGSTSSTGSSSTGSTNNNTSPYAIPFATGLQGDSEHMVLYLSHWPHEVFDAVQSGSTAPQLNDQRRITYWLAAGGLARQEVTLVTSDSEMDIVPPGVPDEESDVIAAEVKSLTLRYFDGTQWQDTWDGSQVGTDGTTPMGPPVAVEITLGIVPRGKPVTAANTKTYRRVVTLVTAPNPAVQTPPTATTTSNSTTSGSTTSQ